MLSELPDDEYRSVVQTLNKEQKEFFIAFFTRLKHQKHPFTAFLVLEPVLVNHINKSPRRKHLNTSIPELAMIFIRSKSSF